MSGRLQGFGDGVVGVRGEGGALVRRVGGVGGLQGGGGGAGAVEGEEVVRDVVVEAGGVEEDVVFLWEM